LGLPPDRFWDISPKLAVMEMEAMRARLDREADDRIELAWVTANLMRMAKIPAIETLLRKKTTPKHQTKEQLQASFDLLAAMWGAKPR
jgi:hypothetical protein